MKEESIYTNAFVVYNNCVYISEYLSLLGYTLRQRVEEPTLSTFVDLIFSFQTLGKNIISIVMQKALEGIDACIQSLDTHLYTTQFEKSCLSIVNILLIISKESKVCYKL